MYAVVTNMNKPTHSILSKVWHLVIDQFKVEMNFLGFEFRSVTPIMVRVLCSSRMSIIFPISAAAAAAMLGVTEAAAKANRRRSRRHNLSKLTASGDFSRIAADYAGLHRSV